MPKQTNDRTWCFLGKDEGDFDDILLKNGHYFSSLEKNWDKSKYCPLSYRWLRAQIFMLII